MYEQAIGEFRTPKGAPVYLQFRLDTSDWNTLYSCLNEDEYGLGELTLGGAALDVGAHIGGVAVGLAVDNPALGVIAIEALPENADLLRLNAARNGVSDRVRVVNAAAGAEPGEQTIHYRYRGDETHEHHAFIGNISLFRGDGPDACPSDWPHEHVTVPVAVLDDFPDARFIKIDCEGGEWGFLQGDLSRFHEIRGEWHPTNGHVQADLTSLLSAFDVTYKGIAEQTDPTSWMGFRAVRR